MTPENFLIGLVILCVILLVAPIIGIVIDILAIETAETKPYEPIANVRYIPHWYLKDPLPRNVKPKELVNETGSGVFCTEATECFDCKDVRLSGVNTGDNNLRLIAESVTNHNGLVTSRKTYEKLESCSEDVYYSGGFY